MSFDAEFADEGEDLAGGAPPPTAVLPAPDSPLEGPNPYSIRGRLKRAFRVLAGKDVEQLSSDPDKAIRQARAHQENRWRNIYAFCLLLGMLGQVAFADWIFWRYLDKNDYEIDPAIFIAFFTSVVVEVIGLVLVVTRSLFPNHDEATAAAPRQ